MTFFKLPLFCVFTAIVGISIAALPAFGDGGGEATPPRLKKNCEAGKSWGIVSKKCVSADKARKECKIRGRSWSKRRKTCGRGSAFGPKHDNIFLAGRSLAYDGNYSAAIERLEEISTVRDPRVLNLIGFSFRKLGLIDTALAYYKQALAINPDFVLARSYLGEGYVKLGHFDLARAQLRQIKRQCGTQCREYKLLERALWKAI